jgi:hypothetical protein
MAYKSGITDNGKQKLTFKWQPGFTEEQEQKVPCGKCLSCKLSYAKEWALRIYHENSLCTASCFLTLTYNDDHLPSDRSVHRSEVVNFIKRLRKKISPIKIKTFYCGEYGSERGRPHYHIILLGYDFPDKEYLRTSQSGNVLWESKILDSLWTDSKTKKSKGFANIGEVTFESAGYIARYCLKKTKDKKDYVFVDGYDEETGEITKMHNLNPEFIGMSQGIGKNWHELFKEDTDKDYLETNGFKHKIPRYYDKLREKADPDSLAAIKEERERKAKENASDNTTRRRLAKNEVKKAQNKMLIRSLEND